MATRCTCASFSICSHVFSTSASSLEMDPLQPSSASLGVLRRAGGRAGSSEGGGEAGTAGAIGVCVGGGEGGYHTYVMQMRPRSLAPIPPPSHTRKRRT